MAQIQLSWPANPPSELVRTYEVWEQINGGFWNFKAEVTDPVYVFTPAAVAYRWRVRAVNFVGFSDFTPDVGGPAAPSTPGTITVTVVE